jgi:hypothetical protein
MLIIVRRQAARVVTSSVAAAATFPASLASSPTATSQGLAEFVPHGAGDLGGYASFRVSFMERGGSLPPDGFIADNFSARCILLATKAAVAALAAFSGLSPDPAEGVSSSIVEKFSVGPLKSLRMVRI